MIYKSILVLKLFIYQSIGYEWPILVKLAVQGRQYKLQKQGHLVFLSKITSLRLDYFGKKLQSVLYLCPLLPPELIALIQIFRPLKLMCSVCLSRLIPSYLNVNLTMLCPLITLCTPRCV